jgi:hypothetical protein
MVKNPITQLEDNNIGSLDLFSADLVNDYLWGYMPRKQMITALKYRRKEMLEAIKGIDKLVAIAAQCPPRAPTE